MKDKFEKFEYDLVELNMNYIKEIVSLHNMSFKCFFLTSLGSKFLYAYYSSCLKNKDTIAIGVIDLNNNLNGFAIGTLNASGYHLNILINNFYLFFMSLIKIVCFKPNIFIRLILNLNKNSKKSDIKDYAELLSIAVMPEHKSSGLGKLVLQNFEINAKKRGAKKIALTTDFYNNESVLKFYQRNSYKVYYDFTTYPNRKMYKMIKDII
jgi:GNAT superfamily N-acetyltransferase